MLDEVALQALDEAATVTRLGLAGREVAKHRGSAAREQGSIVRADTKS